MKAECPPEVSNSGMRGQQIWTSIREKVSKKKRDCEIEEKL